MAKKFVLWLLLIIGVLLLSSTVAGALDRRDDVRNIDGMRYNILAEKVYEGRVLTQGHVVEGLMYFPLKTEDMTAEVQIGPEEFVRASGFKLRMGDIVTVAGMPLVWNGRDIVLARVVNSMTSVLAVRDRDGDPMWETNRPIRMDPEVSGLNFCKVIQPEVSGVARAR